MQAIPLAIILLVVTIIALAVSGHLAIVVIGIGLPLGLCVLIYIAIKNHVPKAPAPVIPSFAISTEVANERAIAANFPNTDDFAISYAKRLVQAWEHQLPSFPLFQEMVEVASEIYEQEQLHNPIPPVSSSDPIAIGRYKDSLARHMRKIADAPATIGLFTDALTRSFRSLRDALPVSALRHRADLEAQFDSAQAAMSVRTIDVVADLPHLVYDVAIAFYTDEIADIHLFETLKTQLNRNDITASGDTGRYVRPWEHRGTRRQIVDMYLGATPLHDLFDTQFPLTLHDESRFAGHWILSPPGRGKTTLLHAMVMEDIGKPDACLILIDSKGDFIDPIRKLSAIQDRLIVIDPDPSNPVAINPLDIAHANIAQSVDLLEYLFASLLEFKMTAMQTTLFRSVLRALVTGFPNPNLETFRDLLANGYEKYNEYIQRLPLDLRDFFVNDFNEKNYSDRRREVLQRLRLLLDNETMRAMLTAANTRFHIGEAMDSGKIVIINNSKARLGDQGAEFFGRFFIAQVLAAAQQRSTRRSGDKPPVYFYIDECQNVIARDEKIPTILDECRSQNIALIMAHQRTRQISSENVLDALSNCAIRFANSDEEARQLAPRLRTSPEFLQSLRRGEFAAFVRDEITEAIAVSVNRVDFSKHEAITARDAVLIQERMRRDYGIPLQIGLDTADTHQAPPPPSSAEERAAETPEAGDKSPTPDQSQFADGTDTAAATDDRARPASAGRDSSATPQAGSTTGTQRPQAKRQRPRANDKPTTRQSEAATDWE